MVIMQESMVSLMKVLFVCLFINSAVELGS